MIASMTQHEKLPESLAYLQAFADHLARLPPDELNEDIDPEQLIVAIRDRYDGENPDAAASCFRSDVELLESWLSNPARAEHPAHWIAGFLCNCEFSDLLEDLPPAPACPGVSMACPSGWDAESSPPFLSFRSKQTVATFMPIDETSWSIMHWQWQVLRSSSPPDMGAAMQRVRQLLSGLGESRELDFDPPVTPRIDETHEFYDVTFGNVTGVKHVFRVESHVTLKDVAYLLEVPGGKVHGRIVKLKPGLFDENAVEDQLSTLQVTPPVET